MKARTIGGRQEVMPVLVAGVDEAGRGPLAGPVTAAAVVLGPGADIAGLADSKTLTARRRSELSTLIRAQALSWSLGWAAVEEIDHLNILQATLLAMTRAVAGLSPQPELALVDGNRAPLLVCPVRTVVGGDASVAAISAASIVAKVARDEEMRSLDRRYPGYGLATHKGYPTPAHLAALHRLGASECHRRSFAPVRRVLSQSVAVVAGRD